MSLNPANSQITIRAPWTPVYGRGQANTARIELELAGAAVTPSAVTYTLLSPVGVEVTTGAASVAVAGAATFALTASHLTATSEMSAHYLERWAITYSGGVVQTYERSVIVARRALSPPIGQTDLEQRLPNLARQRTGNIANFQGLIDQAWADIIGELMAQGILPARMVQPSALRAPMLHLSAHLIYESFAAGQPEGNTWAAMAKESWSRYQTAMKAATAQMDANDDGLVDGGRAPLRSGVTYPGAPDQFVTPAMARARGW